MRPARGLLLLAAAGALYTVAALAVPPGFFDGFNPPQPYRWVKPPPCCTHNNQPPLPGHLVVKVGGNGQTDPGTAFTDEPSPQASLSFLPGAFDDPDRQPVTIDITPATTFPDTGGLQCATNVYLFKAGRPLKLDALVTLRYSDQVPAPGDIWTAPEGGGAWTKIGSTGTSSPFYISARSRQLGYFAGCYPPGSNTRTGSGGPTLGGGQTLPIIVALAIVLVVLGGIPLAVMRRRAGEDRAARRRRSR